MLLARNGRKVDGMGEILSADFKASGALLLCKFFILTWRKKKLFLASASQSVSQSDGITRLYFVSSFLSFISFQFSFRFLLIFSSKDTRR